jgi:hypothetical protein
MMSTSFLNQGASISVLEDKAVKKAKNISPNSLAPEYLLLNDRSSERLNEFRKAYLNSNMKDFVGDPFVFQCH